MRKGPVKLSTLAVVSWRVRSAAIQPLVVASQPSQSEAGPCTWKELLAANQSLLCVYVLRDELKRLDLSQASLGGRPGNSGSSLLCDSAVA